MFVTEMRREYHAMTFLKKGKGKVAARIMAIAMSVAMIMGTAMTAQAATYYKGVAKSKVNLREAPSSKATKAGTLEKGAEVVLVANVKKGNVVNGYTADMSFFKLSTGEYVASQYITAGEAIDSGSVDGGGDSDVPDESGETEEDLVADSGDSDDTAVAEIDLDTGEVSDVEGVSGEDLEPLDASDDSGDDEDITDDAAAEEESEPEATDSGSSTATGTVTADALKVRVSPSMSGTVIKKLSKGEKVSISQSIGDGSSYSGSKVSGNWYKLNTGGFVAAAFVKVEGSVSAAGSSSSGTTSYKVATAKADTTMYSKPLELSTEAGTLKKGDSLRVKSSHGDGSTVSGMKVSGNWYRLDNGNYVKASDVTLSTKTENAASLASDTELKAGDKAKTTTKLNMRKGPGTSYGKQSSLSKGASVTIDEIVASGSKHDGKTVSGTWAKLSTGGYVSVGYLEFVSSGSAASDPDEATGSEAETQEELDDALPEE